MCSNPPGFRSLAPWLHCLTRVHSVLLFRTCFAFVCAVRLDLRLHSSLLAILSMCSGVRVFTALVISHGLAVALLVDTTFPARFLRRIGKLAL